MGGRLLVFAAVRGLEDLLAVGLAVFLAVFFGVFFCVLFLVVFLVTGFVFLPAVFLRTLFGAAARLRAADERLATTLFLAGFLLAILATAENPVTPRPEPKRHKSFPNQGLGAENAPKSAA